MDNEIESFATRENGTHSQIIRYTKKQDLTPKTIADDAIQQSDDLGTQ